MYFPFLSDYSTLTVSHRVVIQYACAITFDLHSTLLLRVRIGDLGQLRQDVINLRRDIATSGIQQGSHCKTMTEGIDRVQNNLGIMETMSENRHVEIQTSAVEKHMSVSSALQQLQNGLGVFQTTAQDENQQLSKEVAEMKQDIQNCRTEVRGALSELQKCMSRISKDLADLRRS